MAKLYFRYGAMNAAKTLNLLSVRYNYLNQGLIALVIKPVVDTRFGQEMVKSRAGMECKADLLLNRDTDILKVIYDGPRPFPAVLLLEEAQFCTCQQIEQLRLITEAYDVPVICYGLRTNYKTCMFEGSKRLFELADSIEEVKTICTNSCTRKAIFNARFVNGSFTKMREDAPEIAIESQDVKYYSLCFKCYNDLAKFNIDK